jgi:hypothetical protein
MVGKLCVEESSVYRGKKRRVLQILKVSGLARATKQALFAQRQFS